MSGNFIVYQKQSPSPWQGIIQQPVLSLTLAEQAVLFIPFNSSALFFISVIHGIFAIATIGLMAMLFDLKALGVTV